jgi:hypothetical protein
MMLGDRPRSVLETLSAVALDAGFSDQSTRWLPFVNSGDAMIHAPRQLAFRHSFQFDLLLALA